MSEPEQKCVYNAIFKQIYSLKLLITFKMAYSCCFSFGGNLDFPEFLQTKFYNINYRYNKQGDAYMIVGISKCQTLVRGRDVHGECGGVGIHAHLENGNLQIVTNDN